MKYRIAIAEDNYFLARTLKEKLAEFKNVFMDIVATNGEELLILLKDNHNLDAIIMDIEMPKMDGIKATAAVKKLYPQIGVIMLTVFEDDEKIYQAIKAGASGYLLKEESGEKIYAAIQQVCEGGASMSAKVTQRTIHLLRLGTNIESLTAPAAETIALSSKETEVLQHISAGLNYKEIASNISISPSTVRKHTENIYKKMGVHNKMEAVAKANEMKLI